MDAQCNDLAYRRKCVYLQTMCFISLKQDRWSLIDFFLLKQRQQLHVIYCSASSKVLCNIMCMIARRLTVSTCLKIKKQVGVVTYGQVCIGEINLETPIYKMFSGKEGKATLYKAEVLDSQSHLRYLSMWTTFVRVNLSVECRKLNLTHYYITLMIIKSALSITLCDLNSIASDL